jgi:hypothetical protein
LIASYFQGLLPVTQPDMGRAESNDSADVDPVSGAELDWIYAKQRRFNEDADLKLREVLILGW